ncbi:MAG: DUF1631 family protein [Caldimonas sp.]
MSVRDPSPAAALQAGRELVQAAAETTLVEVAHQLLILMRSAPTYHERSHLAAAQAQVLDSRKLFVTAFQAALRERVQQDLEPQDESRGASGQTDWHSVGLVGDEQIEERLSFERIGQLISHACEGELRELAGYMSTLLRHAWADPERNPLRGEVVGTALHKAIEKASDDPTTQKIFARELGLAMARAMPACYQAIIADLKRRGIRPAEVALRPAAGHGGAPAASSGAAFDDARKAWEASWQGRIGSEAAGALRSWENSILGRPVASDPLPADVDSATSADMLEQLLRGIALSAAQASSSRAGAASRADAEMLKLLRRLNGGATYRNDLDTSSGDTVPGTATPFATTAADGLQHAADAGPYKPQPPQPPAFALSELMAANLIRSHRDELKQASRGKLDHLVIEVVSSLFDQILSDERVPQAMAGQIARLQLPVLRVVLDDPAFFSSRRHPVRRFINRIGSLACAFDTFETGPGKELLARVSSLVREIVEGDFDHLESYGQKLFQLERFIAEQTHAEVRDSAAAATLRGKELEWHTQQRFGRQLRAALAPVALPAFVQDFLCGPWAQAIAKASGEDGDAAAYPKKLRSVGARLVASLQPKRSPDERQRFLSTLPALMADLREGLGYVGWPEAARNAFFGELVAQHAGSLKRLPLSDLDHNLMLRALDNAFATPMSRAAGAADPGALEAGDEVDAEAQAPSPVTTVEQTFSPAEASLLGLLSDSQVVAAAASPLEAVAAVATPTTTAGDDDIDADTAAAAESPRLLAGPALRDRLQLGYPYRLNLADGWEKIRLTYMSPSRDLFMFSHGAKDRKAISMTSRMLGRLCEAGRLQAFEEAFLIDRSTERARAQLAALSEASTAKPRPDARR